MKRKSASREIGPLDKSSPKKLQNLTKQSLLVLPSSVCPGWGVYALEAIPQNTVLAKYHGLKISDVQYKTLYQVVQEDEKTDQEKIDALEKIGISIRDEKQKTKLYQRTISRPPRLDKEIDWDAFMDSVGCYAFERRDGYIIPENYNQKGQVLFSLDNYLDEDDYTGVSIFVNEAPLFPFVNLLTGQTQKPKYHVRASKQDDDIIFVSDVDILAGEEIFLYYGYDYHRDYLPSPTTEYFDVNDFEPEQRNEYVKLLINPPVLTQPTSKRVEEMRVQIDILQDEMDPERAKKRRKRKAK